MFAYAVALTAPAPLSNEGLHCKTHKKKKRKQSPVSALESILARSVPSWTRSGSIWSGSERVTSMPDRCTVSCTNRTVRVINRIGRRRGETAVKPSTPRRAELPHSETSSHHLCFSRDCQYTDEELQPFFRHSVSWFVVIRHRHSRTVPALTSFRYGENESSCCSTRERSRQPRNASDQGMHLHLRHEENMAIRKAGCQGGTFCLTACARAKDCS